MIKILIYIEPWIEGSFPGWKSGWIEVYLAWLSSLSKDEEFATKLEFYFIIGDAQKNLVPRIKDLNCKSCIIDQKELKGIFPNYSVALKKWYEETFTTHELNQMINLVKSKLSGYEPDVIISFMSPVPFLKETFKDCLIFYQEVSMLCHNPPYPTALFLDYRGTCKHSVPYEFSKDILKYRLPRDRVNLLEMLREKYCKSIASHNPFEEKIKSLKGHFKFICFLPLQYNGHFYFDSGCNFKSQLDLICYVLDNIDETIAVIVTGHLNILDFTLHDDALNYLRNRYKNFIYFEELEGYTLASHYVLSCSDLVITVSSSLGFQCLLWDKPYIALGDAVVAKFSDGKDVSNIEHIIKNYKKRYRDGALYYLLTHYYIPTKYLFDFKWFMDFLERSMQNHKNIVKGMKFYQPIDTIDNLFNWYADYNINFGVQRPLLEGVLSLIVYGRHVKRIVNAYQQKLSDAISSNVPTPPPPPSSLAIKALRKLYRICRHLGGKAKRLAVLILRKLKTLLFS